jgi:hypothetical protein
MQSHKFLSKIVVVTFCFFFADCATVDAPSHWLSDPDRVASDVRGGWISIKSLRGRAAGELIAVSKDTVFVADSLLRAVASGDIASARLVTYDASNMGDYVFLGTLATVSNGWFLFVTAPMWIIGGSIAATSRSFDPVIDYPSKPLMDFAPFARYPQGLPPGLDRGAIQMKMVPEQKLSQRAQSGGKE